jgi:hypothetical protein
LAADLYRVGGRRGRRLAALIGLIDLSIWQKLRSSRSVGGLLAAGYIDDSRSRMARERRRHLALLLGSTLATSALLIATLYHRFEGGFRRRMNRPGSDHG